jgi:hypothetical protein
MRADKTGMLYVTPRVFLHYLLYAGPGAVIIPFDVESAYNTLFLNKDDLHEYVQMIATDDHGVELFVSLVNTFGTCDAPEVWQAFAALLKWSLETAVPLLALHRLIIHYVDNYWCFLPARFIPPEQSAQQIGEAIFQHLDSLGVPFHENSIGTEVEAIGWRFGSLPRPWFGFKPGKRALALVLLEHLDEQKRLSLEVLQRAKGLLLWVSQLFVMLRPLVAVIQDVENKAARSGWPQANTPEVQQALRQASRVLASFSPDCKLFVHPGLLPEAPPDVVLRSDASGIEEHGLGVINVTEHKFFCRRWTEREFVRAKETKGGAVSSTFLEAVALLQGVKAFASADSLIEAETDSDNLRLAMERGWARHKPTNAVIADIIVHVSALNSVLRVRQILRHENQACDHLSHLLLAAGDVERLQKFLADEFGADAATLFTQVQSP